MGVGLHRFDKGFMGFRDVLGLGLFSFDKESIGFARALKVLIKGTTCNRH